MKKTNKIGKWGKRLWKEKGFYMVLAACIAATGIASFVGVQSARNQRLEQNNSLVEEEKKTEDGQKVEQPVSDLPISQAPSSSQDESSSLPQEPSKDTHDSENSNPGETSQKPLYILPCAGEKERAFSGEELVYFETLNCWQTHGGIDIACPASTPVKAPGDGKVTRIYDDPIWGVTIEITHDDQLVSLLCGLSPNVKVHEKDAVTLGDVLGEVGVVPCESGFSHLHFAMLKEKHAIDPMTIVTVGS